MRTKEQYLRYITACKGYSANTIAAAANDITSFARWAQAAHKGITWHTVTKETIQEYATAMHEQGAAAATIKRRVSSLRSYGRYLVSIGALTKNPAKYVTTPKLKKTLPQTVDKAAIDTVISWGGMVGAFTSLAYDSGMRLQEILDLNVAAMDFSKYTIRVKGKGGKERYTYFTETTAAYFRNIKGRPFEGWTQIDARNAIARAFRALGRKCSPHTLRHSFATDLITNGCDIETVKQLMGHEDINTTSRYLNMPTKHLHEQYNKYHS